MKKTSLALAVSLLAISGMALAATPSPTSEIRESTDPDKAAAVERRAEELRAQQDNTATGASGASNAGDTSGGSAASGQKHGKKHHPRKGAKHHREGGASGGSSGTGDTSDSSSGTSNAPASGASSDQASPSK